MKIIRKITRLHHIEIIVISKLARIMPNFKSHVYIKYARKKNEIVQVILINRIFADISNHALLRGCKISFNRVNRLEWNYLSNWSHSILTY